MDLRRIPSTVLVALGLACGPSVEDDGSASTCLSTLSGDDDGTDVGSCLSECLGMLPTTEDGTTTEDESDVDSCLDATGPCLSPPEETTDSGSSFIVVTDSSDSGTSTDSGTDSGTSDSGTSDSGTSDSGTSGSTSGGAEDESPRARSWREAMQRMEDGGALPADVLAKLRAQKGPR